MTRNYTPDPDLLVDRPDDGTGGNGDTEIQTLIYDEA